MARLVATARLAIAGDNIASCKASVNTKSCTQSRIYMARDNIIYGEAIIQFVFNVQQSAYNESYAKDADDNHVEYLKCR